MKICAKGKFGEFEWTLPDELAKGMTEFIGSLPAADQTDIEKDLISDIERQVEAMILIETMVVAKALLGKVEFAYLVRDYLSAIEKEMIRLSLLDDIFSN